MAATIGISYTVPSGYVEGDTISLRATTVGGKNDWNDNLQDLVHDVELSYCPMGKTLLHRVNER